MNIQLRDSKPIQDAVKFARSATGQPMPKKPQLHPELLNGHVDAHREGFDIRSEIMYGDSIGMPNATDLANLKLFLPAPAGCEARWRTSIQKQGDVDVIIPQELIFTFEDDSKLSIHTQSVADTTKLTSALPADQSARFIATPSVNGITIKRQGSAPMQVVATPMVINELKTAAGILGVPWDNSASLETMAQRIAEAREAKADEKPKKGKKEELQPA